MDAFEGRVAVVTGSASGVGRGIARQCAREGMKLVLADVDRSGLAALEAELGAGGTPVCAVETDVRDAAAVEQLAQQTLDAFGGVHLVFNNAGVMLGGYAWERSADDWRWILDVNLLGVVHGLRTFMPILLEQGEPAHMVNTASIGGLMTGPFMAPYLVTKHAVLALTECAYHDLASLESTVGISVLCPGPIDTGIVDSERVRPSDLGTAAPLGSDAEREFDTVLKQGISEGMPADDVGPIVFEALREDRFWIYTHPQFAESIRDRADGIARAANPTTAAALADLE